MENKQQHIAYNIKVRGLVQGVGFRPFIYRLAHQHNVKGWVKNTNEYVLIRAEGIPARFNQFMEGLRRHTPKAATIHDISLEEATIENFQDFTIHESTDISEQITEVSPDIAVCEQCLVDMKSQKHRINYPFINCTNCGPRFSIIEGLPYDRPKTTMKDFVMCPTCKEEYENIIDRRFHAQPIACNHCGPIYSFTDGIMVVERIEDILKNISKLLKKGKIVAVKGIGGFHVMCDAANEKAVKKLRKSKHREGKPFAVMFRDIATLRDYAFINEEEEKVLTSHRRPVVLLKQKKPLAPDVNVGFETLGVMLPYMPFHHLLFEYTDKHAYVLTSGNISDEPIVIDNKIAGDILLPVADALLTYNREIHNRVDDSVTMVVNRKERIIRRSRGYAPIPVKLNYSTEGIIATGAELVNCFCVGKGQQAILSQHIGDLKNPETYDFYTESMDRYKKLFRVEPVKVVADLHPDYFSTQYAVESGIPMIQVQHHHAHIASCMAEHGLDEKVIGVSLDGTGLGDDGNIWGGEFFVCSLADYERVTHFDYVPIPGGDKAVYEPWRTALAYLYQAFGDEMFKLKLPLLRNTKKNTVNLLIEAMEKKINAPLSSSAGRLFDAVSALLGLCTEASFHAEAPMRLEAIVDENTDAAYKVDAGDTISFNPMFKEMVQDMAKKVPKPVIASKFHNSLISVIFATINTIKTKYKLDKVVLSGGVFQNKYLSGRLEGRLTEAGFKVYNQQMIPCNDGGIALGQMAIAAKREEKEC